MNIKDIKSQEKEENDQKMLSRLPRFNDLYKTIYFEWMLS